MIRLEDTVILAADLGKESPLPDFGSCMPPSAKYELDSTVPENEIHHLGKGMPDTVFPYTVQRTYGREKRERPFKTAILENAHLKAIFLLELGGRLWSLYDKDEKRELLYRNPVFQPGNLALRNAWFSGGVEFNVGIRGHNPHTSSPMHAAIDETPDGEVLRIWEYERIRGVTYSVSAWLPEDSRVLYLRPRIENTSDKECYTYWWSNIAVPETPETRVIVPAREAYACSYREGRYLLGLTPTPSTAEGDHSYPSNIRQARDYFFKIPSESPKWIAAVNGKGEGLLQCSTARLLGRKLFVWGQGEGGRHWSEWLSEPNSYYVEIQAGIAHTQLEHIPLPAKTSWDWVEAYTALRCEPSAVHGDYDLAVSEVGKYLDGRVGSTEKLPFPEDSSVISRKIVHTGSGWGALEELLRGERISSTFPFPTVDDESAPWRELLETGRLPERLPSEISSGYVSDPKWIPHLCAQAEPSYLSLLHLGLIRYAANEPSLAAEAWERSLALAESPTALYCLAMLCKEKEDRPRAKKLLLRAMELAPDCLPLAAEIGTYLTSVGEDGAWLALTEALSDELREVGRIRFYRALALLHLDRLDEARQLLTADLVVPDVKEGEVSLSRAWIELYRRIHARDTGAVYDPENQELNREADAKYPVPRAIDFRMS